jgi:hypothetical protein
MGSYRYAKEKGNPFIREQVDENEDCFDFLNFNPTSKNQ